MNKQEKKEAYRFAQRAAWRASHPDMCFCEELGIDVDHNEKADEVIGTWLYYSKFDYYKENPSIEPYYKCSVCGKKWYVRPPAMA